MYRTGLCDCNKLNETYSVYKWRTKYILDFLISGEYRLVKLILL